jgi:hypothetical protein
MRLPIACALVLSLATSARAQSLFGAELDAASVVPPTSSTAGAYGSFSLDATGALVCTVKSWGVTGTAASIFVGAVGVNGTLLASLSGGPSVWTGTTATLSAADKASLRSGDFYVEIDSAAFPAGELRGQLFARPLLYGAHLTGDQETPQVATSAFGDATFTVNSNLTITYSVVATGLTGTAAHIHTGAFGVGGGVLFALAGGPTKWSGTTAAMTRAQFATLQTDGLYVNVHTSANPNGEIRGQIVPSEITYGVGSPGSAGVASLHAGGAAMRGGTLGITIDSGLPNGAGLLVLSLSDGNAVLKTCPYLTGAPLLFLPVGLDAGGSGKLSATVPDLASSIDVYMQYFGFDPSAPNGAFYSTNGLLVPIFDY